ncbi:MAG: fatty acid desaturase [Symploca sp. SIO1B1]|nr:fatty acid desaturase [Symploca sp. SIO1B1]
MNNSSTHNKSKALIIQEKGNDYNLESCEQTTTNFHDLDIRISDIIKTLPAECFNKNEFLAWFLAFSNILVVVLGFYGLAILPWYFLPVTWVITGTGLAGFFTLAHDCGHYAFSGKRWVNDFVGHLVMLPLLYPFYSWCIEHNCHHTRTNKIGSPGWRQIHEYLNGKTDPNWQPFRKEVFNLMKPRDRLIYSLRSGYFWWIGTIINWWYQITLDVKKIPLKDQKKVKFSRSIVLIFILPFFTTLIFTVGFWGVVKFWLVPWLIYHFWFSTFTLIHHTSPETEWKVDSQWNAVRANLCGTIHCDYPWWVEFLCHDINYHVPHHISPAIPFYNLRMAHCSLQENWNPYLRECKFSWSLIKQIISKCHLYDSDQECYISFKEL